MHSLIADFSTAALTIAVWLLLQDYLQQTRRTNRRQLFGAFMAFGAVSQMPISTELGSGVTFDLHTMFVALAGFLGGPIAASVAGPAAAALRFVFDGGPTPAGLSGITMAVVVGLLGHWLVGRRTPDARRILLFSVVASSIPVGVGLLQQATRFDAVNLGKWAFVFAVTAFCSAAAATAISATRKRIEERKLLLGVFAQAPDYVYVKDRHGRFVAVNDAVAKINRHAPDEMRGLTDFDITSAERAQALFEAEQAAMGSGEDIIDQEELVFDGQGERWYSTSKSIVRNVDGEVLGLAGVTRDITAERELSNEVKESRSKLGRILAETADGIASFDRQGTLTYCNENYSAMFPLTAGVRRSGIHIRDILYTVAETYEQNGIPDGDIEGWVDMVASTLTVEGRQEIELYDGRWMLVRTRPSADGAALVVITDITESRKAQISLAESKSELSTVLSEMSDGIAMFDTAGKIVFCNNQYRTLFPLTGHLRIPGADLKDLLLAASDTGEQKSIPAERLSTWIEEILRHLTVGGEEEVELFDDRWLRIKTKPMDAAGGAIVVVTDVTKAKEAEKGLLELTQQLKRLASTDGLTGLLNRRSFDEGLRNEVLRARRNMRPVGLVMIDIDRFKMFNDTMGHPAGDACIRMVAGVLRDCVRRPADLVARYGGEELCVILPETDEAGTLAVAELIRVKVRAMNIEHLASEKGVVTVSVGVACYSGNEPHMTSEEIVSRADEALYSAKAGGRDQTAKWFSSPSPESASA